MALVFNADLDIKGNATLAANKDITLSGGGELLGLPASPSVNGAAASKAYVDSQVSGVTGVLHFEGSLDASTLGSQLDDAEAGDYYIVTVAGTIFGTAPVELAVGDHLVCTSNVTGTPDDGANWSKVDNTESTDIIRTSSSVTSLNDVSDAGSGIIISAAERSKLSGIEAGATGDQTGAEIKSAYEGEADTNAYTDAEKSKLAAIEAGATADQDASEVSYTQSTPADWTVADGSSIKATLDEAGSRISANDAKVSADGLVTTHSDVSDAGSGAIITTSERAGLAQAAALLSGTAAVNGSVFDCTFTHSLTLGANASKIMVELRDASTGEPVFGNKLHTFATDSFKVEFVSDPGVDAVAAYVKYVG